MSFDTYEFAASDGHSVFCYRWRPKDEVRAIIHIAHGMGEHGARYDWAASKLAEQGYLVYANDHRGHGKTGSRLGKFGDDGWNRAIKDLFEIIGSYRQEFPGKKRILFGHSMGAMLTQQYIECHGDSIDVAILSGSPGFAGWVQTSLLRLLVGFERWRLGPDADSALLQKLLFGASNKNFEDDVENPTGFEWLSRDQNQVKRYVDDRFCGFVPNTGSLHDIFSGARWTQMAENVAQIPTTLPLYVFSGEADPVHVEMKNINRMLAKYRAHGLAPDTRFYPGGRHEMLNETNQDEVIADVIGWLDTQVVR